MQMYGDSACLQRALVTIDEYTIVSMRGSEEHAEEDLALVSRALRRRPGSPSKPHRGPERAASLDSEGGEGGAALHTVAIVSQCISGMQVRCSLLIAFWFRLSWILHFPMSFILLVETSSKGCVAAYVEKGT